MAQDPHDRITHATGAAIDGARALGLEPRRDDWRDIMLAITDTLAEDGQRSLSPIAAAYIGPLRDGERWGISGFRIPFDVLYSPERAQVYRVTRRREGETMTVTPSSSPLVGADSAYCP